MGSVILGQRRTLYGKIKELQNALYIVIVRYEWQNRLQVYGQAEKISGARRLLCRDYSERYKDRQDHCTLQGTLYMGVPGIQIDLRHWGWTCHVPPIVVILNSKRILVTGSEDQHQTAVQMLTKPAWTQASVVYTTNVTGHWKGEKLLM